MYDINLKNIKKGYIFGFIFFIIGFIILSVFLTIPLVTLNNQKKYDKTANPTNIDYKTYKNDEGSIMYTPIYSYEVEGNIYTCKAKSSSSSKNASLNDLVYYKLSNPSDCMTGADLKNIKIIFLFTPIPLIFVIIGIVMMLKVRKKINRIKYLSQNGTLIKKLPYTLENTNISVNGRNLQTIAVNYTLPNGTTVHLVGEARYDYKTSDEDQLVDLLIDLNDPTNYFIDFNIDPKY